MTKVAEQRCAHFRAEAVRERLGDWPSPMLIVISSGLTSSPWLRAVALTLLLAVGSAAAQEPPQRTQPSLVRQRTSRR